MTDATDRTHSSAHPSRHWQRRLVVIVVPVVLVVLALVLPPLFNISRYQHRVTEMVSRSFGRPVHLSGVELRLLPVPGFVLHDLTVADDPAFGVEPVLSARTVVASVRLLSLWHGKPEVSRISVEDASLNVVRNGAHRWNLETLLSGPGQPVLTTLGGSREAAHRLPYLEATSLRINLKDGVVKSPFSLTDAEMSVEQTDIGQWHLRLRGQPARTDSTLSFEVDNGTGEVRIDGTLHAAAQLRQMPIQLQMEWRDAQLGQLSRLLLGSDAGWRGDLLANLHVEGTVEAAKTALRLRATGVRRAEFAAQTPLDFDANCAFTWQHSVNAFHDLVCNSPLGSGLVQLRGELSGASTPSPDRATTATLTLQKIPVQAGLDLLRTLRSGFAPGIDARGTLDGSLAWNHVATVAPALTRLGAKSRPAAPAPLQLTGAITVDGADLHGGQLTQPLTFPRFTLAPALAEDGSLALAARLAMPLPGPQGSAAQSLAINTQFTASGYRANLTGTGADLATVRQLAYALGLAPVDAADGFAGGSADLSLSVINRWIHSTTSTGRTEDDPGVVGTFTLHHTRWQAPWLLHPVDLPLATLSLSPDAVGFAGDSSFAALKANLSITAPLSCSVPDALVLPPSCLPVILVRFASVDAGALQSAFSGKQEEKSLLAPLMDRMRGTKPSWPNVNIALLADSFVLGPVTLHSVKAGVHVLGGRVLVDSAQAGLLGGSVHVTGALEPDGDLLHTSLEGSFTHIQAAQLGQLMSQKWTGETLAGSAKLELTGTSSHELATTAKGKVTFDWTRGSIVPELAHFDRWVGQATFAPGQLEIGENQLIEGKHTTTVTGSIPFAGSARLAVVPAEKNSAHSAK